MTERAARLARSPSPMARLVVAASVTFIAFVAASSTGAASRVASAQGDAAGAGVSDDDENQEAAALTQRTCKDQCHTEDRITETRRAAFEWARLVIDMEARGARASEDEFVVIQQYLQRHFGFVNVNRASASELRAVLGVERRVAAAILDFRKRHGPFSDIASLTEVPGLDRETLDHQAEALRFN